MNPIQLAINLNRTWNQLLSSIMIYVLKLGGAKIGQGCYISMFSKIASKKIEIGNDVTIKKGVRIKTRNLVIGNSCVISEDCYMTGSHDLSIGDMSYIGKRVRINVSRNVLIGRDVGLGEGSVIWTHGYFPPADEGYPITYAPVTIKDQAWVSTGIIVLPGITIGEKSIIGAGSVVTKNVPDTTVFAGNPAREVKKVSDLLHPKPFLDLMRNILDTYLANRLHKSETISGLLIYHISKYRIVVLEKIPMESFEFKNSDIVLFKHIKRHELNLAKTLCWFDFNDRIQMRTSNAFAKKLNHFFRGFGMRFVLN